MYIHHPGNYLREPSRPYYHFSPEKGWMNDPNGLVYYDGEYHLFYQHIPDKIEHNGLLHWGHAKSCDLLSWQHLPTALFPNANGDIWSGSIVIDYENTSMFRTGEDNVMIAIFTQGNDGAQEQGIAYSNDRGDTWTMYHGNPVIPNPGLKDFRDPKVFRHKESNLWILVLTAGRVIRIYTSLNLKKWEFVSEFGNWDNSHNGVWECPDLFELRVDNNLENKKWVMLVSRIEGGPNGGSGMQYFIGDFDGRKFVESGAEGRIFWLDHGKDNYAGTTFSNIPADDGRRIFLGWMNNWQYANEVPAESWRGMMTTPRQLRLKTIANNEVRLFSEPVKEISFLREKKICIEKPLVVSEGQHRSLCKNISSPLELHLEFEMAPASEFEIVFKNKSGEFITIGVSAKDDILFLDRKNSGLINFSNDFAADRHTAPMILSDDRIEFRILIDTFSVEVFANNGQTVLTDLIFPETYYKECEIFSLSGEVQLKNCTIWNL